MKREWRVSHHLDEGNTIAGLWLTFKDAVKLAVYLHGVTQTPYSVFRYVSGTHGDDGGLEIGRVIA